MSYDLSILNTESPLQATDWGGLQSFLAQMPDMKALDSRRFEYDDGMYMPTFWLDYADEEGNSLLYDLETFEPLDENDERIKGKVNKIDVSLPFSADLWGTMMVCIEIAEHLGWKVLDHQTGEYYPLPE